MLPNLKNLLQYFLKLWCAEETVSQIFLLHLFLKGIFIRYRILGGKVLLCFSFTTLNVPFRGLLASTVSLKKTSHQSYSYTQKDNGHFFLWLFFRFPLFISFSFKQFESDVSRCDSIYVYTVWDLLGFWNLWVDVFLSVLENLWSSF